MKRILFTSIVAGLVGITSFTSIASAQNGVWISNGVVIDDPNFKPEGMTLAQRVEQAEQKADEALRDALGFSEDEWKIILPRIHKVRLLQGAIGERSGGMVVQRTSDSIVPIPESVILVRAKVKDFDRLVHADGASETDIKQVMASLREARGKVRKELARERKELVDLVTPRQEAILYQKGLFEQ